VSNLKTIVSDAIAAAIAEHPKYFTPKGLEHAQSVILRKVMAAMRGDPADKAAADATAESARLPIAVDASSREGLAYTNLRWLAGAVKPVRMGDGRISVPVTAQRDDVYALADVDTRSDLPFVTDERQIAAWLEFFSETLGAAARRPIRQVRNGQTGIVVPWPWPPARSGKTYDSTEAA
jgi:hypothetical protein